MTTGPSEQVLRDVDAAVIKALETVDYSALNILGNGEVTVVLGWPSDEPEWVLKPTGPFTAAEFAGFDQLLSAYIEGLGERGIDVVPTALHPVERRDGWIMSYMVQPVLAPETLAENALAERTPSVDDELLVSVCDAIAATDDRLGIDAPISNWAWDGHAVQLLDVGLPMMWDDSDESRFGIDVFTRAFPKPARGAVANEIEKLLERYQSPRTSAVEFIGRLPFFGFEAWCEPAAQLLNDRLQPAQPITVTEAVELSEADAKTIPLLKRLQRMERMWKRRVRRQRYEYFIGDSTY
ncbi:MAG: DUF6206 family protein [Actinomycetota bacterium]